MPGNPGIEQRARRSGVAAEHGLAGQQGRHVGDAAQIEDDAAFVLVAQQPVVEGRHERRALSADGHVVAAQVGNGRDPGARRDGVRVAELYRERM